MKYQKPVHFSVVTPVSSQTVEKNSLDRQAITTGAPIMLFLHNDLILLVATLLTSYH